MNFLFLELFNTTFTSNLNGSFHIGHKRFKSKLTLVLKDKPDTEQVKLPEFPVLYIQIIQPKMILDFIVYDSAKTIIFHLQGFDSNLGDPGIMHANSHPVEPILNAIKFWQYSAIYRISRISTLF